MKGNDIRRSLINLQEKEKAKKAWSNLTRNFDKMTRITEANRRLLSGVVTLLIKKNIITIEEVNQIERAVTSILNNEPNNKGIRKKSGEIKKIKHSS